MLTNTHLRRSFRTKTPRFGRRTMPLSASYQQQSLYYWWWAYLRRNQQYLICCARNGTGRLSKLYADFGDVREDDFKAWWTPGNRGAYLFGEAPAPIRLEALSERSQWDETWTPDTAMVVVVPMQWSKRAIEKAFKKLLKKRHTRARGRRVIEEDGSFSTARYPLTRYFSIHSLRQDLMVYDAVEANKQTQKKGGKKKTYYEIGVALRLVPTAMPSKDEIKNSFKDRNKANVMTVAVSRSYKRARQRIKNVAKGRFPDDA